MLQHPTGFTDGSGTFWPGGLTSFTNGDNNQHIAWSAKYDVMASAADPLRIYRVTQPINNKDAKIHGFEVGGQYFIGTSGVGVQANYTIVKADVSFDVTLPLGVSQFALPGLSDSANVILMYEKYGMNARLAWNWRDAFYQGGATNPVFVAPHQQYDLNLGYEFDKHFSVSFEAINLTGTDTRWYARSEKMLVRLADDSVRYAAGFRYKF
jgi:TonB-dependent receptor